MVSAATAELSAWTVSSDVVGVVGVDGVVGRRRCVVSGVVGVVGVVGRSRWRLGAGGVSVGGSSVGGSPSGAQSTEAELPARLTSTSASPPRPARLRRSCNRSGATATIFDVTPSPNVACSFRMTVPLTSPGMSVSATSVFGAGSAGSAISRPRTRRFVVPSDTCDADSRLPHAPVISAAEARPRPLTLTTSAFAGPRRTTVSAVPSSAACASAFDEASVCVAPFFARVVLDDVGVDVMTSALASTLTSAWACGADVDARRRGP